MPSVTGIAQSVLWPGGSGARIPVLARKIPFLQKDQVDSAATQPHIEWVPVLFGCLFFWGLKRPGREVNSLISSALFKNEWSYTSAPPMCLHGWRANTLPLPLPLPFVSLTAVAHK